jgi:hypothetical protein
MKSDGRRRYGARPMGRCTTMVGLVLLLACDTQDGSGSDSVAGSSSGDETTGQDATTAEPTSATTASTSSSSDSTDPDPTDAATSGGEPSACEVGAEPSLELSHGVDGVEPLDAHPAELVHGVQGGFHILLGLRAEHIDASDSSVVRFTGTIDGQQLGLTSPYVDLVCTGDHQEAMNLRLIWDSTPDFLNGKTAHVQAELTDPNGEIFRAEGDVVIDDPLLD